MDKNKVVKLLKELLNELAPGTVPEEPKPGDVVISTKGDLDKLLEEIRAIEAQNPPEAPGMTEKDIMELVKEKIYQEEKKKGTAGSGWHLSMSEVLMQQIESVANQM